MGHWDLQFLLLLCFAQVCVSAYMLQSMYAFNQLWSWKRPCDLQFLQLDEILLSIKEDASRFPHNEVVFSLIVRKRQNNELELKRVGRDTLKKRYEALLSFLEEVEHAPMTWLPDITVSKRHWEHQLGLFKWRTHQIQEIEALSNMYLATSHH